MKRVGNAKQKKNPHTCNELMPCLTTDYEIIFVRSPAPAAMVVWIKEATLPDQALSSVFFIEWPHHLAPLKPQMWRALQLVVQKENCLLWTTKMKSNDFITLLPLLMPLMTSFQGTAAQWANDKWRSSVHNTSSPLSNSCKEKKGPFNMCKHWTKFKRRKKGPFIFQQRVIRVICLWKVQYGLSHTALLRKWKDTHSLVRMLLTFTAYTTRYILNDDERRARRSGAC